MEKRSLWRAYGEWILIAGLALALTLSVFVTRQEPGAARQVAPPVAPEMPRPATSYAVPGGEPEPAPSHRDVY